MPSRTYLGLTWWGQRWIAALEALGALYAKPAAARAHLRPPGAVEGLRVAAGEVTARVQGRRARPHPVRLRLPVFDEPTWAAATAAPAVQLRHAAALLDGQMPEDVDDVLAGCGVSLFPRPGELGTSCSCPDYANPCKHVAAVHYTLAETFDADPFLLPALRGRDRAALLAGLGAGARAARRPRRNPSATTAAWHWLTCRPQCCGTPAPTCRRSRSTPRHRATPPRCCAGPVLAALRIRGSHHP